MKNILFRFKLLVAATAFLFADMAQAETYYLCHGANYQGDPSAKPTMNGTSGCVGWDTSPEGANQVSAAGISAGNTYYLLGQAWYQKNTGGTYDERNSADMRTPTSGYTTIPDGASLVFQGGRINLKNKNQTLTVPNLTVKPAKTHSAFNVGDDSSTVTLKGGNWVVEPDAILGFNVTSEGTGGSKPRALNIQSAITGTGTLLFYSNPAFLSNKSKLQSTSTLNLDGDFSGFTGVYEFLGNDKFTAVVKNAKAFVGTDPEDFTTNVVLKSVLREGATKGITLSFDCDVTTGTHCVWDFGANGFSTVVDATDITSGNDNPAGKAFESLAPMTITAGTTAPTIDVAAGKTLTINGPFVGDIGLKKTGSGTLVLACPCFATPITLTGTQTLDAETFAAYAEKTRKWFATIALTTDSVVYDGKTFTAMLSREGSAASDIYACYGATNGGNKTNDWACCVKVGAFLAEMDTATCVVAPTEANYLRFFSERDGWSESVYLPETPVTDPRAPMFGVTAVKAVRATSAQFVGNLATLGEGATSVTIFATYGTTEAANEVELPIRVIDAKAFDPSEAIELNLFGLLPQTHLFVRFYAVNNLGVATALTDDAFEIETLARGLIGATVVTPESDDETVAVQCETRNLATGERVLIFSGSALTNTNAPAPATFRVTQPGYAEVLVIGGGGAGACYTTQIGGGGGAGGFQHFDAMYFEAGDYAIAVGPGGIAKGDNGPSGRPSTITFGGAVLVQALGGDGGRRNNNDGTQTKSGKSSGGGVIGEHTWVNLGTPGQGNNGGNGLSGYSLGSGGGGAGTPGGDSCVIDGVKTCGNGGEGLLCAITGEELYYAGGGGGAAADNDAVAGRGGLGGGGNGTSGNSSAAVNNRETRNGVNGLGGGGGGGGNGGNSPVDPYKTNLPGNGGSGTVILSFIPEDGSLHQHPVVQLNALTPVNDANNVPGVDVSYHVFAEGAGKLVTVDFEYGTDTNAFRSVRFSDGAFVASYEQIFTGLRANIAYYGRMKVTDERGTVAYSRILRFTTLDGDDSAVAPTAPRFGEFSSVTANLQHKLELTATGSNFLLAGGSTMVKLLVGTDPLALAETEITVVSLADDLVKVCADALDFDTLYYGAFVIDNGDFASRSATFTFEIPGRSVLLSSTAKPSAESPRKIVFAGVVKALGVGETTAKLYLSTVNNSSLELVQTIAITQAGTFEFESMTFDWDQTVYYRIDVDNSFKDEKWTSTGTAGNKTIQDTASYVWAAPVDGDWNDAVNWRITTPDVDAIGYPTSNSSANLPAFDGAPYTVDFAARGRSITLTIEEGAKVTFRSANGTGWDGVTNGKFTIGANVEWTIDGARVSYGQNMAPSLNVSNRVSIVNGGILENGYYSRLQMNNDGLSLLVDDTSRLGPFVQGNNVAVFGGVDSAFDLRGEFQIGLYTCFGASVASKGVFFRGPNALLKVTDKNIRGSNTATAAEPMCPLVFEVPVGGYMTAPITGTISGKLVDSGYLNFEIPITAPAVQAETVGDYEIVRTAGGVNADQIFLAALPHPDTDEWRWSEDGTSLSVHLVGRPSTPTAPVARLVHVDASTASSVTFAADFRCGGSSSSATWSYKIDDAADWTAIGTYNQVENFESFTVSGLEKGTQHVLHLQGVSEGGTSVADYAFATLGDWATLGEIAGVTAQPYGPYTCLVADGTTTGSFKVLVACAAEISFDGADPVYFTLNSGTYTVDGLTLANEAGILYAAPANAASMTVKVLTREVTNEPLVDVVAAPVVLDDVTIPVSVIGLGGELTRDPANPVTEVSAKLVWGYHPEHLVYTNDLGTIGRDAVEAGVTNLTVSTLPSETFVYAKVVADNGEHDGQGTSHLFTFQTRGCTGNGMLYQATKKGFKDQPWDVVNDASCVRVPGGAMAALRGSTRGGITSNAWVDENGNPITWVGGSMYGYVGYIHLDQQNYGFVAGIDEYCHFRIYARDAELSALVSANALFDSGVNFDGNKFLPQVFTCPAEGWYAVEVFVGDSSGNYGPWSATRALRFCELGASMTTTEENAADWHDLIDDGSGWLFTTMKPSPNPRIFDETAPVVSNAVANVSADGTTMTVTFDEEGVEHCSLLIASDATMSDWCEAELPLALTPGTNVWWQLVATGSNGKRFATVPQKAVVAAEASFLSGPTVTVAQDELTVKGTVNAGLGETWALGTFSVGDVTTNIVLGCWTNGVDRAPYALDWTYEFSNRWNETVQYAIVLSNGVTGVTWTSEPVTGSTTLTDVATYTWIATSEPSGTPKAWNDPANWKCDKATGIGYPTETSTALFTAADSADIALDQDRTVKTFTLNAEARAVFSGPYTFTIPGTGDLNLNRAGITLGARNGATLRYMGSLYPTAANQTYLADNATLHFNNFLTCKDSGAVTTNTVIRLSGAAPLFLTQGYLGPRQNASASYDDVYTFVLNVPAGGWREPVIRTNGLTNRKPFGATDQSTARTTKFRFVVDPESPHLRQGSTHKMVIVDWPYGFSADNIVLTENGNPDVSVTPANLVKKCVMEFNKDDPAEATLLYLTLRGHGGLTIILF